MSFHADYLTAEIVAIEPTTYLKKIADTALWFQIIFTGHFSSTLTKLLLPFSDKV